MYDSVIAQDSQSTTIMLASHIGLCELCGCISLKKTPELFTVPHSQVCTLVYKRELRWKL